MNKKRPIGKQVYDYGTHEALHTASVLTESWVDHVQAHKRVQENPKWAKQAEKATTEMYKLYSMIGATMP